MLASLTLLALSVWLVRSGKTAIYTILPMIFMLVMTLWSLMTFMIPFLSMMPQLFQGSAIKPDVLISGICSIILFVLSILLILEARILVIRPRHPMQ